jgi:L-seryl-tRNA(Ser) seleniumtransferase
MTEDPRRDLPSVDRLIRSLEEARDGGRSLPSWIAREAARRALAEAREALEAGDLIEAPVDRARALAAQLARPRPARVVNATGVVLHTNLGRAAMAPGAASAAAQAAASYTDLELDLASGGRGQRMAGVARLLRLLSGAEDALVVNNGAAAVLLAASTLARGRQVVVSRGELVEIGGSFRVPDILAEAGVELVEVGTTNRTHPQDYEAAIGPRTGLLLKVHRSNFEQSGFVKEVALEELVEIGRRRRLPVVEDLGSATLVDLRGAGLPPESYAPARIASGADLVCFSGEKLMGGPQAGIVLGRAEAVARLRKSQMARALRLGKLGLSALDWTLRALLEGRLEEIPTLQKLTEPLERVEERARQLERRLRKVAPAGLQLGLESTRAPVGGGSLPGFSLESTAVSLSAQPGANRLAAALRAAPVPVVARIADDRVLLDARTLLPGDDVDVEAAVQSLVLD